MWRKQVGSFAHIGWVGAVTPDMPSVQTRRWGGGGESSYLHQRRQELPSSLTVTLKKGATIMGGPWNDIHAQYYAGILNNLCGLGTE